MQYSMGLGLLTRDGEVDPGSWYDRQKAEFVPEKLSLWESGRSLWWTELELPDHQPLGKSSSYLEVWLPSLAMAWDNGILFPGQSKAKGEQKNQKGLHGVGVRKRMVREGRRNGNKCGKKGSQSSWSDVLGGSILPWCQLLLFLDGLIGGLQRLHRARCPVEPFSAVKYPWGSTPCNLAAVSVVKSPW